MENIKMFKEYYNSDLPQNRRWVVTTSSESSDHYVYLIQHPTKPTDEELEAFLKVNGSDFDEDRTYEHVESIIEITEFQTIPSDVN